MPTAPRAVTSHPPRASSGRRPPSGPVASLAVLLLTGCAGADGGDPEPVLFSPVDVAAFSDPGTLTDAWADVDGDGDPDRFVGFNGAPARLYRNDGTAGFVDVASELGLDVARPVRTAAWGDYDADGDPDLFLGFAGDAPVTALYRNDGAAGFVETAEAAGLSLTAGATRQASWIDVDGDGDLDFFLALRDGPNRLWHNDQGVFTDVTEASGVGDPRRSVGAVWFDFDTDGDLDVYVGNMDGDANGLWRNDGGVFTDVAEMMGLADGGRALGDPAQGTVRPCAADFDHDGLLDLSTANYGPTGLLRNPGPGGGAWQNRAEALGVAADGRYDTCAWGDFDHDGTLDLFVNGTVTGGVQYRDYLYRREGGEAFVDVTPAEILDVAADHGATWVDHDRDGDLDLALTGVPDDAVHHLLQNLLRPEFQGHSLAVRVLDGQVQVAVPVVVHPGGAVVGGLDLALTGVPDDAVHHLLQNLLRPEFQGHSLAVRVLDGQGMATRPGAEVRVYAAATGQLVATGLVDTGSGYDAQNDLPVHVGLPGAQPVDVEVTFPDGSGRTTVRVEDVDPDEWRGRALEVRVGG